MRKDEALHTSKIIFLTVLETVKREERRGEERRGEERRGEERRGLRIKKI
jgi:hypothetical protein